MKKCILVTAIVTLAGISASHAQIQKGNVLVGGDIANFDLSLNKGGNFNFTIDPKAAWFIKDNLAVGGYLNFELATAKGAGTNVTYGIGALGRYYFGPGEINVTRFTRVFAEANVGIEGFNPSVGDNTNGLGLGIGPGIAFFVTPNIGLEGLVKYNGIVGFGSAASSSRLTLNFGFQVYLPGRTVKGAVEKAKEK
ncbi:MAG TPA: hypothetical protein VNS32_10405 [Flavisolibacter sp.]|nr:hypothetical protein [Flavisolibacter sp.]